MPNHHVLSDEDVEKIFSHRRVVPLASAANAGSRGKSLELHINLNNLTESLYVVETGKYTDYRVEYKGRDRARAVAVYNEATG